MQISDYMTAFGFLITFLMFLYSIARKAEKKDDSLSHEVEILKTKVGENSDEIKELKAAHNDRRVHDARIESKINNIEHTLNGVILPLLEILRENKERGRL